jgi:hypothetical protein
MDQQISVKLEGPVNLFKGAWQLFKAQWKFLVPLFLFPALLVYVGNLLFMAKNPLLSVIAVIISIIGVVLSIALRTASVHAVHRLATDPAGKLSFKDQYRVGFSFFWSFIWIALLTLFIFAGSAALFVIPAIIVAVYSLFYTFTLVLEGKKGFASLLESYSLVRGRWWGVTGRMLFIGIIFAVIYLIMAGLAFILGAATSGPESTGPVSSLFSLIVGVIVGPLATAYMYNLYVSLKASRAPEIATATFKKWLVAFIVIGILAILTLIALVPALFFLNAKSILQNTQINSSIEASLDANGLEQLRTSIPAEN